MDTDCKEALKINDESQLNGEKQPERNVLIDNYRGWVIFIVFNWCCVFLHLQQDVPYYLLHTRGDVQFGIMDYGMSFFMLASGMTFKLVFEKRKKAKTAKDAYMLSVKRGFGIMGVGMLNLIVLDIGNGTITPDGKGRVYGWEVFGTIGMATIFATLFIGMSKRVRLIAGVLIIIGYGFAYAYIPFVKLVGGYPNLTYCGPLMGIACSGLLLIFSVAGELIINKEYWWFLNLYFGSTLAAIPSIVFTAMAGENFTVNPDFGIWGEMWSISFTQSRPGFLIMSIPLSLTTLIMIWGITELIKKPIILLADMGKNTIVFFFVFGFSYIIITEIAKYIEMLWLDICASLLISITLCVLLNALIRLTGFSFTV